MTTARSAGPHLAEPSAPGTSMTYLGGPPLRRYLIFYGVAAVSIAAIWASVGNILLPLQVQEIEFARWFTGPDAGADLKQLNALKARIEAGTATATPAQRHQLDLLAGFDAAKAASLSVVAGVGVFVTMFIQPIAGVLSDRTRSRWGRRAPYIAAGAVLGAALLIGVRHAPGIGVLIALWAVAQLVINVAQGPLTVTIADRVPDARLSTASAVHGLGTVIGLAGGTIIAGALFAAIGLDGYYPFALALAVTGVLFVLVARDRPSTDLPVPPFRPGAFARSFLVPLRDADYRWVWIAKLVMFFGYGGITAFTIYLMQSYIRPALSAEEATRMAPLLAVASVPCTVIAMIVVGRWSDRVGRRKPFVFWSSVLCALSMIVPMVWPTLPALFVQQVISALAMGAYLVVDQALFIDVLPDRRSAGRDLGLGALAGNFGQAAGPIAAGQIVALTGGYFMVWLATLVIVLMAAVAILPVKRAR
ncbi:MFS transporter [Bailinhaonella thermotolerans]|uniref:MFS transporter n=1 Tax=Bailinhaonella thermotolerans TaxID=1070861 RepID=A0A3A4AYW1_9ACTN|nr:MFS transporter [Bailinhaonella thermotolerans]RJL35862.1 MFS transporter [Bailinhaonella thermotolerans]